MISVIISKFVGDAFGTPYRLFCDSSISSRIGKDGIYSTWIQLRGYPTLPADEYRDEGRTAANVMVPAHKIFCVGATSTLGELEGLVTSHGYYGFPVVDNGMLVGYVTREQLRTAIGMSSYLTYNFVANFSVGPLIEETQNDASPGRCTLIHRPEGFAGADLSDIVDTSPIQMRKEMPLELVTSTFQKMVSRYNPYVLKLIHCV